MAARLKELARYHEEMGNKPRANFYLALAEEERANGVPETLAVAQQATTLTEPSAVTSQEPVQKVSVFTRETFSNYLHEGLKARGQEIALPEPSQAIVEVYNILADNGFDVAPDVYVDRKKGKATYGVIETVVRPDYTKGTQMYYSNPDEDPLARILEKGRTERRIADPDWVGNVPTKSRFALSWDEIHCFVACMVVKTIPCLQEQITKGGIVLRVPASPEFQSAGVRYPHFSNANTSEWLYDNTRSGDHLIGGSRDNGGLLANPIWPRDYHGGYIGFRLRAASPSQKLPR